MRRNATLAALLVAVLAIAVLSDVRSGANSPAFTREEIAAELADARRRWAAETPAPAPSPTAAVALSPFTAGEGDAPLLTSRGSADAHAFMHVERGMPARWNPCEPIRIALNRDGLPEGFVEDLEEALARVTAVTGLRFERVGDTDVVPQLLPAEEPVYSARREQWDPVVVAVVPRAASTLFSADELGVSQPVWVGSAFVTGSVVLSTEAVAELPAGFGSGVTRGQLLVHEFTHLVGLDHVDADGQLMRPRLDPLTGASFGRGDAAGLQQLGAAAGCFVTPAAPGPR